MNIFADIEARVRTALEDLKREGTFVSDLTIPAIEAEPPRDSKHGDIAVNAALVLAKPAKMKPRDIADALKKKLEVYPDIAKIEIAGPGFLNITFKDDVWQDVVRTILKVGSRYGDGSLV
jgi:arginyl-tRNA synthetase